MSYEKQERIESAQKRIQELKKLIDYWLKNEKTKTTEQKNTKKILRNLNLNIKNDHNTQNLRQKEI